VSSAIESLIAGAWQAELGRLRTEYALADLARGTGVSLEAVLAFAAPHLRQLPLEPREEQAVIHADNAAIVRRKR
jgi:hypothetical protein